MKVKSYVQIVLIAALMTLTGSLSTTEAQSQIRTGQSITSEDRGFINTGNLVVARIIAEKIRGVRDHREVRKHIRTHDPSSATIKGMGNRRVITGSYQWNNMRTGRPFGEPIKYEATVVYVQNADLYHICTLKQAYGPDYLEWEDLTEEFRLHLNRACR